ncbi:hypothetical protein BY458DRAFT_507383 [Sporodiniella umbellata]|nr:hypothetical protein BY458DRAFT_507383 [Sporodiniella umbellata]
MTKLMTPVEEYTAKRWFAIGAYQSGATEKAISQMTELSLATVHNLVAQFKKSGTPMRKRPRTVRKDLSKGYDKYGRLVDSDNEELEDCESENPQKRKPSAENLIEYVLKKAQVCQFEINPKMKEEEQTVLLEHNLWRPPTPPYGLSSTITESNGLPSPPLKDVKLERSDWTVDQDKILMTHLLTRLSSERWPELVEKLKGKHTVLDCKKRWELLRGLVLKGTQKSGTNGWWC